MKPIFVIILLIGIILVIGGVWAINQHGNSINSQDKVQPKSTWIESKYRANEVITVAQAQYPISHRGIGTDRRESPTIITTQYNGNGVWTVNIGCPVSYLLEDNTLSKVLYFHEINGALNSSSTSSLSK
jgi:hypothetical protein